MEVKFDTYDFIQELREPYDGFFAEQGFLPPNPPYQKDYDVKYAIQTTTKISNKDKDVNNLDDIDPSTMGLLPVFPVILAEQVLYIQHARQMIELVVDNEHYFRPFVEDRTQQIFVTGTSIPRLIPQNESATRISIVSPSECEKRVKAGEQLQQVMQPSLDALARVNLPHWLGYVVEVGTSSTRQTVVLQEDFKNSKEKFLNYKSFLSKTVEELYEKLSQEKVELFLDDNLPKLYELFESLVKPYSNEKEVHHLLRKAKLIDANGKTMPGCEDKINTFFETPFDKWLKAYEKQLALSGLDAAEKELAARINDYCAINGLGVHIPKEQNYRKSLLNPEIMQLREYYAMR